MSDEERLSAEDILLLLSTRRRKLTDINADLQRTFEKTGLAWQEEFIAFTYLVMQEFKKQNMVGLEVDNGEFVCWLKPLGLHAQEAIVQNDAKDGKVHTIVLERPIPI